MNRLKISIWHNVKKLPKNNKVIILFWTDNTYTLYNTVELYYNKNIKSSWNTIAGHNVKGVKIIKWFYLN